MSQSLPVFPDDAFPPLEPGSGADLARLAHEAPEAFVKQLVPDLPQLPAGAKRTRAHDRAQAEVFKTRQLAPVIIALWLRPMKQTEIARICGCSVRTVKRVITRARTEYKINDALTYLTTEVMPDAIDVIGDAISKDRDKDMALEVAKGMGLLQSYSNNKGSAAPGVGSQTLSLTINNIQAPPSDAPKTISGTIVGVPRSDAEDEDA